MGQLTASPAGLKLPAGLFHLVDDHDLRSRPGHPDHLLDGAGLIGEEVDAAHVKYAVEDPALEGKPFGLALKKVRLALPTLDVALALAQHVPGKIEPIKTYMLAGR